MKILHITTSSKGGAGIAAVRLHEELLNSGIDSNLLTLNKFDSTAKKQYQFNERDCSMFPFIIDIKNKVKYFLRKLHFSKSKTERISEKHLQGRSKEFEHFSFPFSSFSLSKHPLVKKADVIHLHWVSDGFIDYEDFFTNCKKKIIWTLHDMNPFTGGCHHSDGCNKYETTCNNCPQLKNTIDINFAQKILEIKILALKKIENNQMIITAPSKWLTLLSHKSVLFKRFRHHTIANICNDGVFKYQNKNEIRKILKITSDKKIILFVSHSISHLRKGTQFLIEALKRFNNDNSILLCSVGANEEKVEFNFDHKRMGYINDERTMAKIYSAADVFVLPSMAENFPNTICESLLCGTPVVAFNLGGIPELLNEENGILVEPYNVDKLYHAIDFVLKEPLKFNSVKISNDAATNFRKRDTVKQFINLYS